MSEQHLQVWVRNDKGQVYGPLSPPSIELLIDNNVIGGRMQISTDGMNYVFPGRVPGLRMIFPKDCWGDTIIPGDELDAQWSRVALPAVLAGQAAATSSPSGIRGPADRNAPVSGPVSGPSGPVRGPGAPGAPTAGPGARQQQGRGMVPGQVGASRPSGVALPVMRPAAGAVADFMKNPEAPVRSAAPAAREPSVADFMDAPSRAVPPAVVPASASVAGVMNAPAPVVATPSAPARPVARVPVSMGSGLRSAPPVGDLQMPLSGSLAEHSSQQLYYHAAVCESTGLLTVKVNDRELVAHFRKGNAEFLESTHAEDSLDTFLLAQRLATQVQIDQAQAQSGRFGGELLAALFGLGLINPNAVFQQLGQRASALLQRILSAEHGTFSFDLEELPASKALPMGNKWAVYLEALRRVPVSDLRRRLTGALELPVMKATGRVQVSELRLTPQETRALNYFDGVRSLSELMKDLPAEGDTILRTAWMLAPLELISFAGVSGAAQKSAAPPPMPAAVAAPVTAPRPPPAGPPKVSAPVVAAPLKASGPPVMTPQPATRPPAPTVPAAASPAPGNPVPGNPVAKPGLAYPGGQQPAAAQQPSSMKAPTAAPTPESTPASAAAEAKQLQEIFDQMKKQNFFEVLGLKREADAAAVKIAYLKAARSYHPDTVAPGSPESLAKLKADVFALIGEANRTLSDAMLRADYSAELDAGGTGSKVDMEKIFRGEELFRKGRLLVQARKYSDALTTFEEAVGCNPDEAEFYAWRGYAKYLAAKDRKTVQTDAMRDLKLCIAKNPNVASTYYFMGFIAKANGDEKTAIANFKKCVVLDPKHIDAQREIRMTKG